MKSLIPSTWSAAERRGWFRAHHTTPHRRLRRRGAMLILVAVLLIVLIVTVVFSVDVAYMQLTRTQLRSATDAAARAAAESLSRTQDTAQARAAAKAIATKNLVANCAPDSVGPRCGVRACNPRIEWAHRVRFGWPTI